jgi:phosphate-selective porin OprO/OprP
MRNVMPVARNMRVLRVALCICLAAHGSHAHGQTQREPAGRPEEATGLGGLDVDNAASTTKPKKTLGLTFTSADGRFSINPWLRGQFRYSDPFDNDPLRTTDFDDQPGGDLEIRRARLKIEGHVFSPKIGFYFEHELSGDHPLLDLRLDLEVHDGLQMRIGQYKILYNRERVDSSGQQQFVERSIATYAFTLDRQIGATIAKQWGKGSRADNWLMLSVVDGDGIDPGARSSDPMFVGRWQWHFLGEALPFSQSDLKFRSAPAATIAFGGSHGRGPYTRFSSSGGGQLDGFTQGGEERYTLKQWLQEFAWHYAGMSLQQEFHVKKISDHETSTESTLTGGYAQFGKAWRARWDDHPVTWELALRLARVDWETPVPDRTQDEVTVVANLFFAGHNNKLSFDVSRISLDEEFSGKRHDNRFRAQWDVSF